MLQQKEKKHICHQMFGDVRSGYRGVKKKKRIRKETLRVEHGVKGSEYGTFGPRRSFYYLYVFLRHVRKGKKKKEKTN